ncbi:hypothetical protein F373_gp065 [Bacillus phage SP-10]|uniref:hypothetical protein n=1 Tax=Bacillus phage SP10 TaxID=941058 RepID=UPI0002198B15|nr:hypothetical protein F373_gp065 [Bacillus phage SP-10]BAK52877.1 hypothetical protein [Bacillus phage SP-10]
MKRVNKTKGNLKSVIDRLDDASGALYNAIDNLSRMNGLGTEIEQLVEKLDPSRIDLLKHELIELLEQKGEQW